jgi:hypothetical protein
MWSPNTVVGGVSDSAERFNPTVHFNLYGMGWFLSDYQGRKVVTHSGGLDGMTSRVGMLPEENLGFVILTNSETPLQSLMMYKVFDVFLGVPPRDWSADYMARAKAAKEREEAEAKKVEAARVQGTKPSLPTSAYAGTYTGAMFGDAKVTEENGRLVLRLAPSPNFVGDLEHWHYDTFRVKWRESVVYPFPRGWVTFTLDPQAKVSEMKVDVPNPDFDFKELEFKRAPETADGRAQAERRQQKMYEPKPIDTSGVELPRELLALAEKLAESTHDNWSKERMRQGWTLGPERSDRLKQHPGLVPYAELSEEEKDYDRVTSLETLKAIYALGYRIVPREK